MLKWIDIFKFGIIDWIKNTFVFDKNHAWKEDDR